MSEQLSLIYCKFGRSLQHCSELAEPQVFRQTPKKEAEGNINQKEVLQLNKHLRKQFLSEPTIPFSVAGGRRYPKLPKRGSSRGWIIIVVPIVRHFRTKSKLP